MNKLLPLLILLILPLSGFGFTFTATPTAETCTGNGSLSFNSFNADPAGSIVYEVYLLPNSSIPLATVAGNTIGGLSAGTYRIVAKETVGTTITTQQQEVTINFSVTPLTFNVDTFNQACSTNSNITIETTSGTAVSYEIFSGPVTFPQQTENTFSGLPVGVYRVRVFDNCGTGVVSTFTVTLNPAGLIMGVPTYSNTIPPSCGSTVVNQTINAAPGTVIGYPLNIQYIVHPPGGGPNQTFTNTINSGNLTTLEISQTIPYFINQSYDYDLIIQDDCGSTFTNNFIVNQNISILPRIYPLVCNTNYFDLLIGNFTPPFSLTFDSAPTGFNPTDFNSDFPGPFSSDVIVFGSSTNPVPIGTYGITITDFCGRTTSVTCTVSIRPSNPVATGSNNGCSTNSGNITISIQAVRLSTAVLVAAPVSYPFPLPHDLTPTIDALGNLTLNPVPLGDYTFLLTDECGDTLDPVTATVPIYTNQGLSNEVRPGCGAGEAGIGIGSRNIALSSVLITAAPTGFGQTLPFNVSNNITPDGICYLGGLPAGNYTFETIDACNFSNALSINLPGYNVTSASFSLQANCGSFNIPLNFNSNGNTNETFWLQKLIDADTNQWGHPGTGQPYAENTVPDAGNSIPLQNNNTNLNLNYNGVFRIVHSFATFHSGSTLNSGAVNNINKNCIEILSPTLTFNQVLEIVNAHRMPCTSSGALDVILNVNGEQPLQYSVVERDGQPFFLNNGNSNIFFDLPGGIYTFQVQDNCGNIVNRVFDVNTLLSLVSLTTPSDLLQCTNLITNNETFDLSVQSPIILGTQSPTDFTISYHPSLIDAESNTNQILNINNYNPPNNPQTIFARVIYNPLPICYETISFDLTVGQNPRVLLAPNYLSCQAAPVTLDISQGNLVDTSYLWSDSSTDSSLTISQIGSTAISATATNSYGNSGQGCSTSGQTEVVISEVPVIDRIETVDWTANENSISVITSNAGAFEYALNDSDYQSSNTFSNLSPGLYTVFVRDQFGCGLAQKDVWLLHYPYFFTPNDDTYNDTWSIPNAILEPDLKVYVYDRYGKLMTFLDRQNPTWDGTYNGRQAVSTDYWFVVSRQDGRTLRGHFTLKR